MHSPTEDSPRSVTNFLLSEGEQVWVEDNGQFIPGSSKWSRAVTVRMVDAQKVLVRLSKLEGDRWAASDAGDVEVPQRLVHRSNADRQDECEDIAELSALSEPAVMEHIRMRYVGARTRLETGERPSGIYTRAGVVSACRPQPLAPGQSRRTARLTLTRPRARSLVRRHRPSCQSSR